MYVISLFETSGNMVRPWAEQGYECYCFDITNQWRRETVGKGYIQYLPWDSTKEFPKSWADDKYIEIADVVIRRDQIAMVFGFPPCTDLAVSGARWFKSKAEIDPDFQAKAMDNVYLVKYMGELVGCPYMIENPVSVISSKWRRPDYTFHPYHYTGYCKDDNYRKKTCLWVGNGFNMPPISIDSTLGTPDDRIHKAGPSPERAMFRSTTPKGFAKAVYLANGVEGVLQSGIDRLRGYHGQA